MTGTITLTGKVPADTKVTLQSNLPYVIVPGTVTVGADSGLATFNIAASTVTAQTVATISATLGATTLTIKLTVNPTVSSVTLAPSTVSGGLSSIGTVTMSGKAPAGGLTVTLASTSTYARVPATVLVPAGDSFASFTVQTLQVKSMTPATITATTGSVSASANLTISH